ncbi:MAG: DUF692 family protein [Chryseobacterium sp.]|nr:MAG: DUF692 family protein [Chryseobacterium sp.]
MSDFVGIGILYNRTLDTLLETTPDAVDYLEIIPDTWFSDKGVGAAGRFDMFPAYEKRILELGQRWPLVAHHVGFSLGTAGYFDAAYLDNVIRLQEQFGFLWNSDHLSYSKVHDDEVTEYSTCLALPLAFDEEVMDMLSEKIGQIKAKVDTAFLMENNVYFVKFNEEQYEEGAFLAELCNRSGCDLLLDLHNVHANATNFNFDRKQFIDSLDLSHVVEIHIAGGNVIGEMYLDSHSGKCNDEVWELLDYVVPNCPNLRGVTFEFHESYFNTMGNEGIVEQLEHARAICLKSKTIVCP